MITWYTGWMDLHTTQQCNAKQRAVAEAFRKQKKQVGNTIPLLCIVHFFPQFSAIFQITRPTFFSIFEISNRGSTHTHAHLYFDAAASQRKCTNNKTPHSHHMHCVVSYVFIAAVACTSCTRHHCVLYACLSIRETRDNRHHYTFFSVVGFVLLLVPFVAKNLFASWVCLISWRRFQYSCM